MAIRWSPQIEISRPRYVRSLATATVCFLLLGLAETLLIVRLVHYDLSKTYMIRTLEAYRNDFAQVERRLNQILKTEGRYDLFKLQEKLMTFTQQVTTELQKRVAISHVAIYDREGRVVDAQVRLRSGFVRHPALDPLAGSPGGPSPPGDPSGAPLSGDRGSAHPGVDGPPTPPGRTSLASKQMERFVVIPVGDGHGDGTTAGMLEIALDEELLRSEVAQLQKDLYRKIAAGAFLTLVVMVVGFLYVLRLLQRTRRLEAEAQMADRLAYVGTLASGLAHEIRNPLNAMNMNLQMIEEELGAPAAAASASREGAPGEETRALLASTQGEIRRLERLVSDFLSYARPSPPSVAPRDLNRSVEEVVAFLGADLAAQGITVESRLAPGLPEIEMDEAQFRQAVLNILVNARQVLGPGGRIEISTLGSAGDGEVMARISDNGPGIPPDKLDKIFEVFYSTRKGGTGLGLPIAQRIIENHGGRIEVESQPGRGTTFTIVLPRRARVAQLVPPAAEPAGSA